MSSASPDRTKRSRNAQNVLTKFQRYEIAKRKTEQATVNDKKRILSKAVSQFCQYCTGTRNANLTRALCYWNNRNSAVTTYKSGDKSVNGIFVTAPTRQEIKLRFAKAGKGRGRKRSLWVSTLHRHLLSEFERLHKVVVKFSKRLHRVLALFMIDKTTSSEYNKTMDSPRSGWQIVSHVTLQWIQSFMQLKRIVMRSKTRKLSLCTMKQEMVEWEVSLHLGKLSREFGDGTLTEECITNAEETHFVTDKNDGRIFAMKGD